jgi:hypothetical protein
LREFPLRFSNLLVYFVVALLICDSPNALSITSKELETRIHDAKILKEGDNISTVINNDEVTIRKYGANNETDSKIDSVFLAKEVMAAGQSINKVTVLFYDPTDTTKYSEVVVHIPIIKLFASGQMTQADLLASLDVVHKREIPIAPNPSPQVGSVDSIDKFVDKGNSQHKLVFDENIKYGQFESIMKDCHKRIQALSEASQNVDNYVDRYHTIEHSIKIGRISDTRDLLEGLTAGLRDQENALARKSTAKVPVNSAAPRKVAAAGGSLAPVYHSAKDDDMVLWISPRAATVWANMEKFYPDLMPEAGPQKLERDYISDTVLEKKKHGYDVSRYVPVIARLNQYARTPKISASAMSAQVQYAYSLLGINRRGLVPWMLRWQEKIQE